jgi:hypothetical protein
MIHFVSSARLPFRLVGHPLFACRLPSLIHSMCPDYVLIGERHGF